MKTSSNTETGILIRSSESVLCVIDMQERLVPAMQAPARTLKNAQLLISVAEELGVPILLTEQYPSGLGPTVKEIRELTDTPALEKMHFSCMEDDGFNKALSALDRQQVILTGMEAHICVMQTAASLMEEGKDVFVVSDATASRTLESERACLERLSACGAGIVTTEMVVFEWLGRAGTATFKKMLKLIK